MCIAAVPNCNYSISERSTDTTTTAKPSVVRFAMKLPRYNPQPTSSAAAGALLRGRGDDEVGLNVDGISGSAELRNTPRTGSSSTGVRRCQSANAGSRRARTSFIPNTNMMTKSRSHSQEPTSSSNLLRRTKPTELLPIPPSANNNNGHARPEDGNGVGGLVRSVDKTDLTRMYDYATWNMYERIVSARRQRLSAIDTQSSEASSTTQSSRRSSSDDGQRPQQATGVNKGGQSNAVNAVTNVPTFKSTQQSKLLNKTSSTDDSTLATSDETDKSSTTSSSWSRTDLPGTCPTMAVSTMPSFPNIGRPSSCPPSSGREDSDEHFIFELDM